jgi:rare lipoprotein A
MHFHEETAKESGDATWYDVEGGTGACGDTLKGMYAAHKTWPCGSLVSVRYKGKYVFVRVEDRGPYGEGRIVDLSKKAFGKLAEPSVGVIPVHATLLEEETAASAFR